MPAPHRRRHRERHRRSHPAGVRGERPEPAESRARRKPERPGNRQHPRLVFAVEASSEDCCTRRGWSSCPGTSRRRIEPRHARHPVRDTSPEQRPRRGQPAGSGETIQRPPTRRSRRAGCSPTSLHANVIARGRHGTWTSWRVVAFGCLTRALCSTVRPAQPDPSRERRARAGTASTVQPRLRRRRADPRAVQQGRRKRHPHPGVERTARRHRRAGHPLRRPGHPGGHLGALGGGRHRPQTRRIEGQLPGGAVEGRNDFNESGYGGPQPPPGDGVHRYFFSLYALREPRGLAAGCTADDLRRAVVGKELARGVLVGTFER